MALWYLSYDGKQIGPLDQAQASAQARQNLHGYAWREGFTAWVPISEIDELTSVAGGGRPAPPPPVGPARADEIDFKIFGAEMQYVEIELDPGESVIAEAGAMMYKDSGVVMETIFGDARHRRGRFRGQASGGRETSAHGRKPLHDRPLPTPDRERGTRLSGPLIRETSFPFPCRTSAEPSSVRKTASSAPPREFPSVSFFSERSSPPFSAVKVSSSPPGEAPEGSGFNRCPSPDWPAGCSRPLRREGGGEKRVLSWGAWAGCLTVTIVSHPDEEKVKNALPSRGLKRFLSGVKRFG